MVSEKPGNAQRHRQRAGVADEFVGGEKNHLDPAAGAQLPGSRGLQFPGQCRVYAVRPQHRRDSHHGDALPDDSEYSGQQRLHGDGTGAVFAKSDPSRNARVFVFPRFALPEEILHASAISFVGRLVLR